MLSGPQPYATQALLEESLWIRKLAQGLVRDDATADDLAQETLTAALEHRPSTDRSLRPWLARVLRSRRNWHARGERSRAAREARGAREEALPSSSELAARAEIQQRLVQAVLALDDPYRTLVLLRYYEGLEPTEIARRLGRPAGSVRGQLSRAVEQLRGRLSAGKGDETLDWRLALLPLTDGVRPGAGASIFPVTFSPPTTLIAMHTLTKSLVGLASVVLIFGLVRRNQSEAEPTADPIGQSPQVLTAVDEWNGEGGSQELGQPRSVDSAVSIGPARRALGEAVERAHGAAIEGRLMVVETEQPLREFLLELRRDEEVLERFTTDELGAFTSAVAYAAGPYELRLLDHPQLDPRPQGMGAFKAVSVEPLPISWRPGSPLSLRVPPRLELPLSFSGPPGAVASIERIELLASISSFDPTRLWVPLRRGASGSWVRFAPLGHFPLGGDEIWDVSLRATSADGLWSCSIRAPSDERGYVQPLHFDLESRTRLEVTIPWRTSTEPKGLQVTISPAQPMEIDPRMSTPGATVFARDALELGVHKLVGWAAGTEAVHKTVTITSGTVHRTTLALDFPDELAQLELRLLSESGDYHGFVRFTAQAEGGRRFIGEDTDWKLHDGKWTGTQTIDVPSGEYAVSLFLCRDSIPWDVAGRTAVVPGPPFEIWGRDGGPTGTLVLRVVDAVTGQPIEEVGARLLLEGETALFNHPELNERGDELRWRDVPLSARSTWTVEAPGYEKREGDWQSAPLSEGEQLLEVSLQETGGGNH